MKSISETDRLLLATYSTLSGLATNGPSFYKGSPLYGVLDSDRSSAAFRFSGRR